MTSENFKIIFHIGYGKTATTFLQKTIHENAKNNKILYLGKNFDDGFANVKLKDLFHKLFRTYRSESNKHEHPSHINASLLDDFIEQILILVKENKNIDTIYLSDECLGSYQEYHAELNYSYLLYIGNNLKQKLLNLRIKSDCYLIQSIRNHVDMVNSSFAYAGKKLVKGNIEKRLANYHDLFFGHLEYSTIFTFLKKYFYPWEVYFVPMELLEKKGARYFLSKMTMKENFILSDENCKKINANRNNKGDLINRTSNIINEYSHRKFMENISVYRNKKRFQRFYFIDGVSAFIYMKLYQFTRFRILRGKYYKKNIEIDKLIKSRYVDDVTNLKVICKDYNLEELGY